MSPRYVRHDREAGNWATWHLDPDAIPDRAWPIGLDALPELRRRERRRDIPRRIAANAAGTLAAGAVVYVLLVLVLSIGA